VVIAVQPLFSQPENKSSTNKKGSLNRKDAQLAELLSKTAKNNNAAVINLFELIKV
jgi:hypothetical protein